MHVSGLSVTLFVHPLKQVFISPFLRLPQIFLLLCCCSAALHLPKSGATSGFKISTPVRKATASVSSHHFAAEEQQSTWGKMDAVKNVNLQWIKMLPPTGKRGYNLFLEQLSCRNQFKILMMIIFSGSRKTDSSSDLSLFLGFFP